jgi:predicted dehydrogenase
MRGGEDAAIRSAGTGGKAADEKRSPAPSRREFLGTSLRSAAVGSLASMATARPVHAAGSDILKVGLIGCGPRGTGAAVNALNADPNARLTAVADVFPELIEPSCKEIEKHKDKQVTVAKDHCFSGFDGYRQLIASDVDVVLIALPTYFHPHCLQACIDAGKHVFCEKTHAVDALGVQTVLAAGREAERKGLSVVSGLAWRYHTGVRETMKRVHDGAIGELVSIVEICNTGALRSRPRQPGWTEMEYQIRDWFNFFWLSCDLPGLNLVHNLDKAAWALHEEPPLRAWGMGGQQTRVGPRYGDAWDHHAVEYEYANGVRLHAYCRQQDGCPPDISDHIYGTKGRCDLLRCRIEGETNWRYDGPDCNRFDLEHVALFSAIRRGQPVNNSLYMARSSMLAVMATWAAYSGQVIGWEEALRSKFRVTPERHALDADPPTKPNSEGRYPMPVPGASKFV